MQETIIGGPTRPSMQKQGRGNSNHLPAQSAHATVHREVELTECGLEASRNPAEWRRCEERKRERQKKLQIEEKQRVRKALRRKVVTKRSE